VSYSVFAQYTPEIDSLIKVAETQKEDTLKVINLNDICWNLKTKDFDKSMEYGLQSVNLARQLKYKKGEALANKHLGGIHYLRSKYAVAYKYYNESLKLYREVKDNLGISKVISNLGSIFHQQGEYDKAIDYFFQSLEIKIELNDKIGIAKQYNRIGLVYHEQGEDNYNDALEYYDKALKIFEELNYKSGIASSFYRIAGIYTSYSKPQNDQALHYALKFLNLSKEIEDKTLIAQANEIIGIIYLRENQFNEASVHLNNSLKMWEELGNLFGEAGIYLEMANNYYNIKDFKNSERNLLKSYEIAEKVDAPLIIRDIYLNLSLTYWQTKSFEKALIYRDQYYLLKDSLQSEEMTNEITRLEVKNEFNSQLKEQKLEQEKMRIQHEAKEKRTRIMLFAILGGFVFVVIFAIFIYKSLRDKQKANKLLEDKNIEINAKSVEIQKQNVEIQKQHDIVVHQKEEILASISYAQLIQKAVLPSDDYLSDILYDHFILFKPRDIVSGDFYWIKQIRNFTAVVAADCTGHGVPGAFMSMLGGSFLHALVTSRSLDNTAEILNKLRKNIKKALHQKGDSGEQKDGMDLALYIINNEKNKLQFSGAYNPLVIIRNNMSDENKSELSKIDSIKITDYEEHTEQSLIEVKGDKQPIGIYLREKEFTNTNVLLEKGDKLYTFSDGFVDQFGGERSRKFMSKKFKKLLLENYKLPMKEQHEFLDNTIENWRKQEGALGPFEQIDDILVIGIEIS
jgi:serine phosphatase RsbU (regulator of sigma subunit)